MGGSVSSAGEGVSSDPGALQREVGVSISCLPLTVPSLLEGPCDNTGPPGESWVDPISGALTPFAEPVLPYKEHSHDQGLGTSLILSSHTCQQ